MRLRPTLGLAGAFALSLICADLAQASDFWDEVRTPGLGDFRRDVRGARSALGVERYRLAQALATRAIERLPDRAEAYLVRGQASAILDEVASATEDFDRALALDPHVVDAPEDALRVASVFARASRYQRAADAISQALGQLEDTALRRDIYEFYGDVLLALGPERLRDAILSYREVLRAEPTRLRARLSLALALRRQGALSEANETSAPLIGDGVPVLSFDDMNVPESEVLARRALLAELSGQSESARGLWSQIEADSPWYAHTQRELSGR